MKLLRPLTIACFLLLIATAPAVAQTITAADAKNHVGEQETVCGLVVSKHVASRTKGAPTFVNLDKPYPNQLFTVLVWENDKGAVGSLPDTGQLCVTGSIVLYHGGAEIVLHNAASWYVPKAQSVPPPKLSTPPASSSGGVPAGATALCRDGTYSFSQHRSGTCSHHGGVAKWL